MRAVVFGASGFLGRALIPLLESAGWPVTQVRRSPSPGVLVADITRADSLAALEVEADVAINLAAHVPTRANTLDDHPGMFTVNAIGAANLAQWVIARGIPRLVHGSTLVVATRPWPDPLTEAAPTAPIGPVAAYAASKLAGELVAGSIVRAGQGSFLALRFSALYGPGMLWSGVMPAFIDAALAGKVLAATSGPCADFLHVEDAARAVLAAASSPAVTGVANVAAGVETSIEDLAHAVLNACGRDSSTLTVVKGAITRARVDVTRLRHELGVVPGVALADGLRALVEFRRAGDR
jgi:nucleoside-diphosphate-sugar epimerase